MSSVWLKASFDGTFNGDRCAVSGLSERDARKVVDALNEEFRDMRLAIEAWVES